MAQVLKPGAVVGNYKVIELAGDGTQSNIYFAERENTFCWLIQIEAPDWQPDVRVADVERFQIDKGEWVAFPVGGTSMVNLASWVDRLELPYIGWRWATLAREIGLLHAKKIVLQEVRVFSLDYLFFNNVGELTLAQDEPGKLDKHAFPVPDDPEEVTAASDVFALGESLKALAGENLSSRVASVLNRATDPDISKRYPNATVFAEALGRVLPDPNREKIITPRSRTRSAILIAVLLFLCLAECVTLVVWAILNQYIGLPF